MKINPELHVSTSIYKVCCLAIHLQYLENTVCPSDASRNGSTPNSGPGASPMLTQARAVCRQLTDSECLDGDIFASASMEIKFFQLHGTREYLTILVP